MSWRWRCSVAGILQHKKRAEGIFIRSSYHFLLYRTLAHVSILEKPNRSFAEALLKSPQLSVKQLPLLSSCLPYKPLCEEDHQWMQQYIPAVKEALQFSIPKTGDTEKPTFHFETLLYLAFQHVKTDNSKRARYVRVGHSRLWFLGQYVVELALAEYFLMRYPREVTACLRDRVFGLTNREQLPKWMIASNLEDIIFQGIDMEGAKAIDRQNIFRAVFWALMGVSYLSMGMQDVYRILFKVFGMDPEAKICQPGRRPRYEDEDHVFPMFDDKKIDWQDIDSYKSADDVLFAKPLLFRACVPPGMWRFKGSLWEIDSLPNVMQVLGYPRQCTDEDPSVATAGNEELELGLQLCFFDHLAYKADHPRFCNERFEYLGQKIQDLVMAEKLIIKHLDGPGVWLQEKHRRLLFNRLCGKYFRELKLHNHIVYSSEKEEPIYRSKNSQKIASITVSQALHGLGYAVYGKSEVVRLMTEVFNFERSK